ncbi:MAG TPA: sigma-70 family RNA polymerase sigma factor [Hyphomicrobiaceae bacterium]|nr:sigma-70 family RNA polymerase sigma factor [Hyphomicrobiaceae bacterium]
MTNLLQSLAERRDVSAFQTLYQTYGPRVKTYMMRHGADAASAEDLAQETLLQVWRKASLYAPDKGSVSTWIFAIARNLRIDRLRRELPLQALPEDHGETASDDVPPDEQASTHERQRRVRAALAALPTELREVLTLAFVDGLSHGAIAERTGVPLGTIKSRIRLGYQKIRTAIEDLA